VIGGNLAGIVLWDGEQNAIQSNFIGVAADGLTALPNLDYGIYLDGADNQVGGTASGEGNRIAHNGSAGLVLENVFGLEPLQNRIRGNAIYANGGLGIDLGEDGQDGNDPGDGDGGPNGRQNYPQLATPAGLVVAASLESRPDTTYSVDVYLSPSCDPSGFGEGQQYLDSLAVTTDPSGLAAFALDLAGQASPGEAITATATSPDGDTSEFSNCVTITEAPVAFLPLVLGGP
jgi:hypothetical protein